MPSSLLIAKTNEFTAELSDRHFRWPERKFLPAVIGGLAARNPKRRIAISMVPGWQGSRYVLPHRVIKPDGDDWDCLLTESPNVRRGEFLVRGDLQDWQKGVAYYCRLSSRLRLALGAAEKALSDYITRKHLAQAETGLRPPAAIPVGDILALYARDVAPKHARPAETGRRITALLTFFGDKVLSDVNGQLCRAYVGHRGTKVPLAASLRTCAPRSTIIAGKDCAPQSSRWSFQTRLHPASVG